MTRVELAEWQASAPVRLTDEQVRALAGSERFSIQPSVDAAGHWLIRAKSHVGVMQFGDLEIRIRPKVEVRRLVELLASSLHRLRIDVPSAPEMARSEDLLGVVAFAFCAHTNVVLRQGLLQGYRTVEEALPTVRGRILVGVQMSKRSGLPLPVELRYDEFTADVLENQLLAGATRQLLMLRALPADLRRQLRRIEHQLLDVAPTLATRRPPDVAFTRLNGRYRSAVALAQVVLRSCSLEEGVGQTPGTGFLVDMNQIFEDVVGFGLRNFAQQTGRRLDLQYSTKLDADGLIDIRPDLLWFENGRVMAVADVKYKQPDMKDIANADLYQVLAYAHRFDLDHVHLIYASPLPVDHLQVGDVTVRLWSVDLATDAASSLAALETLHAGINGPSSKGSGRCTIR